MAPVALIIRTAGTNCDRELAHGFELAGARTQSVHLNQLIESPGRLDEAGLVGFPGGFSYGDDIAAGRIFANRLRHRLLGPLRHAITQGVPMIGICNGFQAMVKLGLLPDPMADPDAGGGQVATLADNNTGRFIARWVKLSVPKSSACLWTQGIRSLELPIAHGEGRFVPGSDSVLARLWQQHQVAMQYTDLNVGAGVAHPAQAPQNPNGSVDAIAGICDPTGLVLGLMPHPERCLHATHHPQWTRQGTHQASQVPAGLKMFQNAVQHAKQARQIGVTPGAAP